MTRDRASTLMASIGAGLLSATAALHFSAYPRVLSQAAPDGRPLVAALWVGIGIWLLLAALIAVAATPLFVVRRRAILLIAAATPLSIAVLQIIYLGFIPPTPLLLVDAAVLVAAGVLGQSSQGRPSAV
jgi:hypothetical protein